MHQATHITAVRHGETAWNAVSRLQGQLDIALNARGLWQAQRVGQALADSGIGTIYCSDLRRAHATALAIAQHSGIAATALHLEQGLRERSFGSFQGLTYTEVGELHPNEAVRWKQRDPLWAPPGGESSTMVYQRVAATLHAIAAQHPGEHIALVTHGGVLDMLYRLATGQALNAPRTWELGNCAINRLLYTPQTLTLVGWADTQHLDDVDGAALDEGST
jgi:probable phosphoglycerate mutase